MAQSLAIKPVEMKGSFFHSAFALIFIYLEFRLIFSLAFTINMYWEDMGLRGSGVSSKTLINLKTLLDFK